MDFVLRHLAVLFGFILAIALIARLLREQRPPANTIAWLLSILLIPYVGVPLYLLIGGRKIRRYQTLKESFTPVTQSPETILSETEIVLGGAGAACARSKNKVELLATSDAAYRELLSLIAAAKETIHIATFIFSKDAIGEEVREELCKRARQGIKVRLLVDGCGSFFSSGKFLKPLVEAGGQVGVFLPMLPTKRPWSANLRNHRKLWIIDDKVVVLGGRNIGQEYLGSSHSVPQWKDFNVKVQGPSVEDLCKVFVSDWNFAMGQSLPVSYTPTECAEDSRVQVVPAGPDMTQDPIREGVLAAILSAKQRVWIVTPYFIPDELILQTLGIAARMGRDVRIIVPRKSNHKLADFARASYVRQLQKNGVRVYGFEPSMIHTKLLIVDENIAVVGSANMDMRSLYLNYEIAVFLYTPEVVRPIAAHVLELLGQSSLITIPADERLPFKTSGRAWLEDVSRLLAPML